MILFQFFLRHLIFSWHVMTLTARLLTQNMKIEHEASGDWTTRWKTANHGTVCLGIKQLPVLSWGQTGLIFQYMKKRRSSAQEEGALKDWEQPQLWATKSYTQSTSQQLQNPLTGTTPTQIFAALWANPISSGEVSYTENGNDHLQGSRTPWVTATTSFWGERGIKVQQV